MIVQEGSNYKFKMASMRDDIVELIVQEGLTSSRNPKSMNHGVF